MRSYTSMMLIVAIAVSYLVISPARANAGYILVEDGIIDACVSNKSGYTRILDPFSRSTHCWYWENPVSWSQNGGGNCDCIMTVIDEQSYNDFCAGTPTQIFAQATCPGGKVLVGLDCKTDPQIPQGFGAGTGIPMVTLRSSSLLGGSVQSNALDAITTSLPQASECRLICDNPASPGISGTLTAVAYCEEP